MEPNMPQNHQRRAAKSVDAKEADLASYVDDRDRMRDYTPAAWAKVDQLLDAIVAKDGKFEVGEVGPLVQRFASKWGCTPRNVYRYWSWAIEEYQELRRRSAQERLEFFEREKLKNLREARADGNYESCDIIVDRWGKWYGFGRDLNITFSEDDATSTVVKTRVP